MGVELGKVLAKNILKQLDKPEDVAGHDSSVSCASSTSTPLSIRVRGYYRRCLHRIPSRPRASSTIIRNGARSEWQAAVPGVRKRKVGGLASMIERNA